MEIFVVVVVFDIMTTAEVEAMLVVPMTNDGSRWNIKNSDGNKRKRSSRKKRMIEETRNRMLFGASSWDAL